MITSREHNFLESVARIVVNMGKPDVSLWIPGTPVSRPSGKPYRANPKRRIMSTPAAQKKEDAKISKAKRWADLLAYRTKVHALVRDAWKAPPIESPCLTIMEFAFDAPPRRHVRDHGRILKSTKPDIKNLTFALEDALNPDCIKDKKGRVLAGFPGLWIDDCLSHTIGWRVYTHPGYTGEGVTVKVWIL